MSFEFESDSEGVQQDGYGEDEFDVWNFMLGFVYFLQDLNLVFDYFASYL